MEALERPAWSPARRCTATNRAGERCQRQPIAGGTVCVMHGGAIPQVQQAAKLRLLALVEPVLATFDEILSAWHRVTCTGCGHVDENGVKCVGCGKPTGDPMPVIRVGQLVLDRAGFHPTLTVEQVAPPETHDETIDETIAHLETLLEQARALRDAEHAQLTAGAVDGFEVPEDEEPEPAWSQPPGEPPKEPAND